MTEFEFVLAGWETFYLLAGTAAATMIGLLFVAVSINIDIIQGRSRIGLQHFAGLTFNCFFYVLVIALLLLVPGLQRVSLGSALLLIGLLGIANTIYQRRGAGKAEDADTPSGISNRFTLPILSLAALTLVAMGVFLGADQSLYGLVVVVVLLLAAAAVNAWSLLISPARNGGIE